MHDVTYRERGDRGKRREGREGKGRGGPVGPTGAGAVQVEVGSHHLPAANPMQRNEEKERDSAREQGKKWKRASPDQGCRTNGPFPNLLVVSFPPEFRLSGEVQFRD